MKPRSGILHLLLLVTLFAACSMPPAPGPTATLFQQIATESPPTSTHTPTMEPSATATETPTATPTATITPFPSPTPLPPGFYANFDAGFSFRHPTSWRLDAEDASFVRFVDQSLGLLTIVVGYPAVDTSTGAQPENIDTVTSDLSQVLFEGLPTSIGETFLVQLGEDIEAPAKDVTAREASNDVLARIVFHTQNFRSYFFIFLSSPNSINAGKNRINNLLSSVQLFSPQPFGLPKDQNIIMAGYDPDPEDLDPARTTGAASDYVGLLFTGLVRLTSNLAVEPDLAESWEISADGTVYTFTLRPGLTFADGSPLTSEDVIFSWERAADPKTGSTTAGTYLGDILGLQDKLDGKADQIEGLQAVDDRTLVVTLDAARPYFLAKLTYPTSFVVDANQVERGGQDWVWDANASGAYVIKEYRETEVMVFERNLKYHTPPAIHYVTHIINPGGSWISRYEDGTLDFLYLDNATTERVRRVEDPLHSEWRSGPSLCTTFLALNNSLPPFDDLLVRKAFALAVDRDAYVERLTNNLSLAAQSLLPPGMPGYSEDLRAVFGPEAAAQALAESSYAGDLPEIFLETSGFATEGSPSVNALVEMWQTTLGVTVKVTFLDPQNYTAAAVKEQNQMALYGWCADYPDPQNFLDVLFHTGSQFNVAGYSNPAFDQLVDQASIEIDPAERIALYQQAEALLLEDYGIAPISNGVMNVLVKPRLEGFVLSPIVDYYLPSLTLKPENP
jgi:oligopeptide transport system substrate-binding protein